MDQGLGIYVSVPFCRAKCTYCNFASGVFGAERMDAYVERLCAEIAAAHTDAAALRAQLPEIADTLYFGGGTPSLLEPTQIGRIFAALRAQFRFSPEAEITLECAPGQLAPETLHELQLQGLNRISFGVQSFSDQESRAVGRSHTRESCLEEIVRMRSAGISNLNLDLIVGLPHQTHTSWLDSVHPPHDSAVPHVSLYMLEVDEDSRLGREVLSDGNRYGAATLPSEDETADWYAEACEVLAEAGIGQYEISNFAIPGFASRHNLKYWLREPYLGFGLDAHSMLRTDGSDHHAVRWANRDDLDAYLETVTPASSSALPLLPSKPTDQRSVDRITDIAAFEETVFLGLRMNEGIDLHSLSRTFSGKLVDRMLHSLADPEQAGLVAQADGRLRLTPQGRMVSNEVFGRVLLPAEPVEV
jgi:oxygen-independent coproporphyrinogen-3 oxidase